MDGGIAGLSWLQKRKNTQKWISEDILRYFEDDASDELTKDVYKRQPPL